MAKAFKTKKINDKLYRLHPTQAAKVKIGFVPVFEAQSLQEVLDNYSPEDIITLVHKADAIDKQAQARNALNKKSITQKQWAKIAAELLKEDTERYTGDFETLDADVKAVYANDIGEVTATEDKIWDELL